MSGPPGTDRDLSRLSLSAGVDRTEPLLDPRGGFEAWSRVADALDAWHAGGQHGRVRGEPVATT
jgi:hypothetical protein